MEIPLQIAARDMPYPDAGPEVKARRPLTDGADVGLADGVDPGTCSLCGGASQRDSRRSIRPEVDVLAIV